MKIIALRILTLLSMAAAMPAQSPDAAPPEVPAAARKVDASTWRYTDAKGVAWIYRATPFGMSHRLETPAAEASAAKAPAPNVSVKDLGDSFAFERKTPFGGHAWTAKKDALNGREKEMVRAAGLGADPAAQPAQANAQPSGDAASTEKR